ncbi:unnamed protein product [Cuscuta europaea]|uniref:B box-type domain-containing protein n=1 Tax=Cuscuta europaea TaxID=41803 RepID=A0A9P1ENF8_CUSEU|nr:unnamed protein product [Cuscuta europaea]
MCKGKSSTEERGIAAPCLTVPSVSCELCESAASLYCKADDAFLCRKCDRLVHSANFLVRRHVRCLLCTVCRGLTQLCLIGTSTQAARAATAAASLKLARKFFIS